MFKNINKEKWISFLCIAALALSAAPLLILGHYNYPSADDWSLGLLTHQAASEGKGLIGIWKAAFQTVLYWRENGEPRYANALLGALQPGIWGEHFYRMTPYLMIGSLFFSEFLLGSRLLRNSDGSRCKWLCPILIPSLILQILYVPYPTETFYWYVGAVNYTFIFSLSLVLCAIFLALSETNIPKKKMIALETAGILAAILVGGDSYSASLSTACLFCFCSFFFFLRNKTAFRHTLPVTLVTLAGLFFCLTAPANQVRLNTSFQGTTNGILQSVRMSIVRTCTNIYSWTNLKMLLMLLLIAPFLWLALRDVPFHFRKPFIFTVFTLGIYAAQITANMYVEGGISACRIADILYYGYHVWLLLNTGYWIGWLQRRDFFIKFNPNSRISLWFCTIGLIIVITCGVTDIKTTSTYRACAWLIQGTAKQYAEEWEKRLAVLHDDSIKHVEFEPLSQNGAEMVFYTDFTPEIPWLGEVCAAYYEKDYVGLLSPESN